MAAIINQLDASSPSAKGLILETFKLNTNDAAFGILPLSQIKNAINVIIAPTNITMAGALATTVIGFDQTSTTTNVNISTGVLACQAIVTVLGYA